MSVILSSTSTFLISVLPSVTKGFLIVVHCKFFLAVKNPVKRGVQTLVWTFNQTKVWTPSPENLQQE